MRPTEGLVLGSGLIALGLALAHFSVRRLRGRTAFHPDH